MINKEKAWRMHDIAEKLCGLGVIIMFIGAIYHVLSQGDYAAATFIAIGTLVTLYYGVLHLKARKMERSCS